MVTVLTIFFSIMLIASSVADWATVPKLLEGLQRMKVPAQLVPLLPICKTLGAGGLLLGLKYKGLGVAAGIALVAYFAVAIWFHLRAKDPVAEVIPAGLFGLLALLAMALRAAG